MSNWLGKGGCPVMKDKEPTGSGTNGTNNNTNEASNNGGDQVNPKNNMLIQEKQTPSIGQSMPLPTDRTVSSIPKADFSPGHQEEGKDKWEYPSEQMLFNAMKRKGWKPEERDMKAVVSIHNSVNETAWRQVMEWETLHKDTKDEVRLQRFQGRPKDTTPKAFIRSLMGQEKPFDRHDWIVQRGEDEVRYVVDFYNVRKTPDADPVGIYIDARPALDSPTSVFDRIRMGFKRIFSADDAKPLSSAYVPTVVSPKQKQPDATEGDNGAPPLASAS